MKIISLPDIQDTEIATDFKHIAAASAITIFGYWFSQIAFFALILEYSKTNKAIAIYYLCLSLPKLLSAKIWKFLLKVSFHKLLSVTQILGAIITVAQLHCLTNRQFEYFYAITFLKGFFDAFVYLYYDSFVINKIVGENNIHKANSIMLLIRYGSVTFFPFVGAIIAQYWGSEFAIYCDATTFLLAAFFFIKVKTSLSFTDKSTKKDITLTGALPETLTNKLSSLFLNNIAYSIFNCLIPIMIFIQLGFNKQQYGLLIAWIGLLAIYVNSHINIKYYKSELPFYMKKITAISIFCNGLFLLLSFFSEGTSFFVSFLSLASFFSFISIGFLKTNIFKIEWSEKSKLPSWYSGIEWGGLILGFLIFSLIGDQFSIKFWSAVIFLLLTISTIIYCFDDSSFFRKA